MIVKDLYLFIRKFTYKHLYDEDRTQKAVEKSEVDQFKDYTMADFRALRDLIQLLNENEESEKQEDQTAPLSLDLSDSIQKADIKPFKLKSQIFLSL